MSDVLWNIKQCQLAMSSEIAGWSHIDVINGGVDYDGTIELNFATDQAIYKEDITGENGQFSFLNSNKCDMKIASMHGSPIDQWVNGVWREGRAMGIGAKINCTLSDPLTGETYHISGAIKEKPSKKYQGELQTVEVNIIGRCKIIPGDLTDLGETMLLKKITGI